jgi:anti-anti-sigma factor
MDITVAEHPVRGATVVTLHGELGMESAGRLRTSLLDIIGRAGTLIVIDLGPLEVCDSIGLSAFVDAHRCCTRAGGYLRLAAPSPFLRRVLSVVGLLDAIPLYDTVAAACADGHPWGAPAPTTILPAQRPGPNHRER